MPHDKVGRQIYKYCLNIIDVASRYKASIPLTDRTSLSIAKAFIKCYNSKKCLLIWPKVLQVDGGSEFKDNVITLMKFKNVRIRIGTTHENQSIVERFNRTLEERLFKIEDAKESLTEVVNTEWVKDLPDIIDDLNNSITRLLGITPNEAILKKMVFALPSKIPIDRPVGINEKRLSIGTTIRYLLDKSDYEGVDAGLLILYGLIKFLQLNLRLLLVDNQLCIN